MKTMEQFDKLALVKETQEKAAGKALASSQTQHQAIQQQLQKLILYRDEYKQRLQDERDNIESARFIRDYHNFIKLLDHAIKEQQVALAQSEAQLERSRDNWIDSKNEVKKVEKIQHRSRHRLQQEEMRMEQKQSDEMCLNRHGRQ